MLCPDWPRLRLPLPALAKALATVCEQCDAPAAERGAETSWLTAWPDGAHLARDGDPTADRPDPLLPHHVRVVEAESLTASED